MQDYWQVREQRMEQARRVVPDLLGYLRQEIATVSLDVEVKIIEPQQVLSTTRSLTVEALDPTIMRDLDTLYKLAEAHQIRITGQPFGIYHGPINHEDNGPIEICLPVEQPIVPQVADVAAREVAGGKAALVTLQGEQCAFPGVLAGYDATHNWIQQNGYEAIEAPREIWYGAPGETAQLDIVWLFREPRAAG